jgi:hypothetical protein
VVGELDRHDLFDRIELRPGAAKRVGDELVRASDRWSIAPLLQIAARRGVSLTVA